MSAEASFHLAPEGERFVTALYNEQVWNAALPVLARLADARIPVIVLKSLPQVRELYGHSGGRRADDVDILVPAARAEGALQVMQDMGWSLDKPHHFAVLSSILGRDRAAARMSWHLSSPENGGRGNIDLHSDGMDPWRDPPLTPDVWERSIGESAGETRYALLSPEDRFIYLCWHFIADGLPWRKLADVEKILRGSSLLDWRSIAQTCRATGMLTVVHLVCELVLRRTGATVEPVWRSQLPVAAPIRQRLLLRLLASIQDEMDQRHTIAVRMLTYDRWLTVLDAAREVIVPNRSDLATYVRGYEPASQPYIPALIRLYRQRLRPHG